MNRKTKRKPYSSKEKEKEKNSSSPSSEFPKEQRTRIILGITMGLISLYILLAMIGFFFCGGIDQSLVDGTAGKIIANPQITVANPAGKIGAWISNLLINHWFGISSFILCYMLMICSFRTAGAHIRHFKRKLFIGMAIILWVSLLLGFITESISDWFDVNTGYLFLGGGHGYFVSLWLNSLIGRVGTLLFLILTFVIILFFGFERTFYRCVDSVKAFISKQKAKRLAALSSRRATAQTANSTAHTNGQDKEEETEESGEEDHSVPPLQVDPPLNSKTEGFDEEDEDEDEDEDEEEHGDGEEEDKEDKEEDSEGDDDDDDDDSEDDDSEDGDDDGQNQAPPDIPLSEEPILLTVNDGQKEETVEQNLLPGEDYDPTLDLSDYHYPTLELLEEHSSDQPKVTQEELEENKNKIVETLRNYKIEITKIKATIGPTVTLYEIVPAPGVKISKIKNLEDDIALSLSALGIRIIAPIPGAGTIGIEVPNQKPEVVSMRGLIASKKFQESKYALPVALGRTISNETYTFDLTKMPHLLVAGATGQGKSVGLNAIITSLLYKKHPSQLKFVMIDPKKVELSIYSVIEKHFLAKLPDEEEAIITETGKVVNTLNSLCIEMDNRYDLLKTAQVRNIKEYNEKFIKRQLNPLHGHKFLPYIVVVVDEFADLIMTAGKEVETPIARIAQLARAVGIHMIIATQRPSTNIITGVIKANFPARIAFKVASMVDSRTILDSPGANQLIGRGDMLISVGSEITRVQCAFVDTPEVDAVTRFIASQQSYPSAFALPEYSPDSENGGFNDIDPGSRDPLFEDAARLVVSSQQGSTSAIQRRFSIGYNRAGRIMDQLESAGIVGAFEGSKARQVLIPDEYSLEQILNNR